MANKNLLYPKYKVIADWPGRKDFEVGQIITLDGDFSPTHKKYSIYDCRGETVYIDRFFDMFPIHFKKLEWWEYLEYRDLPEYIKWINPTDKSHIGFFKVDNWASSPNTSQIVIVYTKEAHFFIGDCSPSTKDEYEQAARKLIESNK